MSFLYKNEEEKNAMIKFLNYYLLDFMKWSKQNKFDLNDDQLTLAELDAFTSAWIEEESKLMKQVFDKSEEREYE